jgi:hypothetical protein
VGYHARLNTKERIVFFFFTLFKRNTFTGTPVAFNRNIDGELVLNIAASDGSGVYVFVAYEPIASQIEGRLFSYRQHMRRVTITVEYDPQDGQTILNFSMITR